MRGSLRDRDLSIDLYPLTRIASQFDLSPQAGRGKTPSTWRDRQLSSCFVPPRISPAQTAEPAALLPDRFLQWFASRGWSPREHQLELLAKARDDRSALLIAPTGAGKTLAGFLPTLVELSSPAPVSNEAAKKSVISTGRSVKRTGGLHTLYISPM